MGPEVWKSAPGFNGYEISNHGRIRNVNGRILKLADNGLGYKKFRRKIGDVFKEDYIHRLVALAFLPNPEGKPCVNHLDCNPANNKADNLEWCTKAENSAYMVKLGRNKRTKEWIKNQSEGLDFMRRAVIATHIASGETIYFKGVNETKKAGFSPANVVYCCKHQRGCKQHKGYVWRYANG